MDNQETIDIAKDTFLEKWPNWVRWIIFLPSAGILSFAGVMISRLFLILFNRGDGLGRSMTELEIISGIIFGALFVYVGSFVVPRHQFIVSTILLVIVTIFTVISFFIGLLPSSDTGVLLTLAIDIAMVAGAVGVVVYIKNITK